MGICSSTASRPVIVRKFQENPSLQEGLREVEKRKAFNAPCLSLKDSQLYSRRKLKTSSTATTSRINTPSLLTSN